MRGSILVALLFIVLVLSTPSNSTVSGLWGYMFFIQDFYFTGVSILFNLNWYNLSYYSYRNFTAINITVTSATNVVLSLGFTPLFLQDLKNYSKIDFYGWVLKIYSFPKSTTFNYTLCFFFPNQSTKSLFTNISSPYYLRGAYKAFVGPTVLNITVISQPNKYWLVYLNNTLIGFVNMNSIYGSVVGVLLSAKGSSVGYIPMLYFNEFKIKLVNGSWIYVPRDDNGILVPNSNIGVYYNGFNGTLVIGSGVKSGVIGNTVSVSTTNSNSGVGYWSLITVPIVVLIIILIIVRRKTVKKR
ncbi:MAG: hypothetical protein QXM69_02835 [Sulfolobaceae archaeon]